MSLISIQSSSAEGNTFVGGGGGGAGSGQERVFWKEKTGRYPTGTADLSDRAGSSQRPL